MVDKYVNNLLKYAEYTEENTQTILVYVNRKKCHAYINAYFERVYERMGSELARIVHIYIIPPTVIQTLVGCCCSPPYIAVFRLLLPLYLVISAI